MAQTHSLDLELSSSQYASIANASQTGLNITASYSIEAWFKAESFSGTQGIVYRYSGGQGYILYTAGGGVRLGLQTNTNDTEVNYTFQTGVWYHVAGTYNSATSTHRLYVNGMEIGTEGSVSAPSSVSVDLSVGSQGASHYFDGLIKDVRVFSDVRTQAEIISDAHTQNVSDANLVGEWNFNNDYTDSSGNSNTLTSSGSPVFSTNIPWEGATEVSGSTYLETSLEAFWPFDESSGNAADSTANARTLTNNNSTSYAPGVLENGADLESTSSQYFSRTNNFDFTAGTVSMWVKPESFPGTGERRGLSGTSSGSSTAGFCLRFNAETTNTKLDFFFGGASVPIQSTTALSVATWYHVVVTWDTTGKSIYVNGALESYTTTAETMTAGGGTLYVGADSTYPTARFDGMVDEKCIYSRRVHYGDVLELYNAGSGISYAAAVSAVSVDVNDTVTVTEDVSNVITSPVSVNDTITVTESVSNVLTNFVSVSDAVTVAENVTVVSVVTVSVSDSITVTENVSNRITSFVSVNDTITVTENVSNVLTSFVSVNDTITVTEDVSNVLTSFVSANDAVTVDENVELQQANGVSVNDTVTVDESVEMFITELNLSVSDDVTVSENVSVSFDVNVSVSDDVSVAEVFEQALVSTIAVGDDVTVDESVEMSITELYLSVSDDVTLDEALDFMFETYLLVCEEVTVDEDVTITSSPDIYDEITVEEDVAISILVTLDVYDEVVVSESTEKLILSFISVSDDVTLTEGDFESDSIIFGPQTPGKRPRGNAYFSNQQVSYGGYINNSNNTGSYGGSVG